MDSGYWKAAVSRAGIHREQPLGGGDEEALQDRAGGKSLSYNSGYYSILFTLLVSPVWPLTFLIIGILLLLFPTWQGENPLSLVHVIGSCLAFYLAMLSLGLQRILVPTTSTNPNGVPQGLTKGYRVHRLLLISTLFLFFIVHVLIFFVEKLGLFEGKYSAFPFIRF